MPVLREFNQPLSDHIYHLTKGNTARSAMHDFLARVERPGYIPHTHRSIAAIAAVYHVQQHVPSEEFSLRRDGYCHERNCKYIFHVEVSVWLSIQDAAGSG